MLHNFRQMVYSSMCYGWYLVLFSYLSLVVTLKVWSRQIRKSDPTRRATVLNSLGIPSDEWKRKRLLGFFHPYCNAGGGGERVLWTAIAAIQHKEPDVVCVVYTGDLDASKDVILDKVKARFDIDIHSDTCHFVFLNRRWLVEASTWPRFTMLGQSVGSMFLAWEALSKLIPDLYLDTMGYAFTFQVAIFLGQIPVGAYVHYPTISTSMTGRLQAQGNLSLMMYILAWVKGLYYRLFMHYYALCLKNVNVLMANSTWTKNHVDSLRNHTDPLLEGLQLFPPLLFVYISSQLISRRAYRAHLVYPPCDTREMAKSALENRESIILSIAQFRPEKNHTLQVLAFKQLLTNHPEYTKAGTKSGAPKLILAGGCRNEADASRVDKLRKLVGELDIEDSVEFVINASYSEILSLLSRASVGINTMLDEHFGINVVEFMAAGVIPVVHASAGPYMDIVVPFEDQPTGYHAKTTEEFADRIHEALSLPSSEERAMRMRARAWAVQRFSEEEFEKAWDASGWRELLFK